MAGSMAISSSRSDEPADAGKLGEMVVGVAEQGVDGGVPCLRINLHFSLSRTGHNDSLTVVQMTPSVTCRQ
jgi:hypothetical protein